MPVALNLGAGGGRQGHGEEAEAGDQRGHEDGADANQGRFVGRLAQVDSLLAAGARRRSPRPGR